ncbi:hypothetical protein [Hoeflea poritis]|uniref:DUF4129 domain-containing protein n=1 Tax=Hoeflea poritis TaxID=2993659 RepID=A0ABT4VUF2_9HYPH|nr:hypothetical protein [Hoeflea poritis]MDA4848341.1 hypothetical protein [Hoeflea poritis]
MSLPDVKRLGSVAAGAICLAACVLALVHHATQARAQQADEEPFSISTVDPPRTQTSEDYQGTARPLDITSDATYADKITGSVPPDRAVRQRSEPWRMDSTVILDGGWGVAITIFTIAVLLFLWLKFGGSSVLLSRGVNEGKEPQKPPETWNMAGNETEMDGAALLRHLARMKDRREALARLLRHCLLSAGAECDTRFARSDTEREAFARLPGSFKYRSALKTLLQDAELAHYGGRPVGDEVFARNLELGRLLLVGNHAGHHA